MAMYDTIIAITQSSTLHTTVTVEKEPFGMKVNAEQREQQNMWGREWIVRAMSSFIKK